MSDIHPIKPGRPILMGLLMGLAIQTVAVAAEPVFRETFNHGKTFNDVGWTLHINPDAQNVSERSAIALTTGKPTNLPAIATGGPADELRRGFLYVQAGNSFLLHHNQAGAEGVQQISFYYMLNSTEDKVRVAVRQGGRWYVSDREFGHESIPENPGITLGEKAELKWKEARWRELPFEAGTSRPGTGRKGEIGSEAVPLDSADIEAVGIYMASFTGRPAFDTFEVYADKLIAENSESGNP